MCIRDRDSWRQYMSDALNLGYGYDRIENVLWRVYHGELDSITADRIVLMIGTNNLSAQDSDEEIIEGLRFLSEAITTRRPEAEFVLAGILPRAGMEPRIRSLNKKIARLASELKADFIDPGARLLAKGGKKIDGNMFVDGVHPTAEGYRKIASQVAGK